MSIFSKIQRKLSLKKSFTIQDSELVQYKGSSPYPEIPNDISAIGNNAFSGCRFLSKTAIPDGVTAIGERAFAFCEALAEITIPGSVTEIGPLAFGWCHSLKEITVPDSVTEIGDGAFRGCTSLKRIFYPKDAKMGIGVFRDVPCIEFSLCVNNGSIESYNGICPGSLSLPGSVTEIEYEAFKSCYSLKEITIPGSVAEVRGFSFCEALEEATVPCGAKIGNGAFQACRSLRKVTFYHGAEENGAGASPLRKTPKEAASPDGEPEIGKEAFAECFSLEEITIPGSVTKIGDSAFRECKSLKEITIPGSVTEIENCAFMYCTSLERITFPDSVKAIGPTAFDGCKSLKEITIPDSVTKIGEFAFSGCVEPVIITNNPIAINHAKKNGITFRPL